MSTFEYESRSRRINGSSDSISNHKGTKSTKKIHKNLFDLCVLCAFVVILRIIPHTQKATSDALSLSHHSSRITHHSSLITHHASPLTHHFHASPLMHHHSSLITDHASPLTHHLHASPLTHRLSRIILLFLLILVLSSFYFPQILFRDTIAADSLTVY